MITQIALDMLTETGVSVKTQKYVEDGGVEYAMGEPHRRAYVNSERGRSEIAAELARAWLIDQAWEDVIERAWTWLKAQEYPLESLVDDDEARLIYVAAWLSPKGYDIDRLREDRVYARRAVLREWLHESGYDPDTVLTFDTEGRVLPHDEVVDVKAQAVCLRLWMETRGEDVADLSDEDVVLEATK